MQLTLLNIWRLGAMDSLHVTSQQTTGSKTSSRSTSPCRPREHHTHHAPHHTKTLSHGSDSGKSQDGGVTHSSHRPSRHRSPTTSTNRTDMEDGSHVYLDDSGPAEADNSDICYTSFFSNGSSEHVKQDDETDNIDPKISATLEQLSNKIIRVRDLIKTEQKMRDDNVNEYLKLAANADKQQVQRIKAVFEKKNQKSAQVISQLQKKLDTYQKRVHELETHGLVQSHRPPREVLRDMGQGLKNVGGNIRDGITGFSGSVMSKPREFAHLIKNKFGSADNISQLSRPGATGSEGSAANGGTGSDQGEKVHHGSATLPATLHTATSQTSMGQAHRAKFPSDEGSECSSVTSDSIGRFGRGQETGSNQDSLKALYKQLTTKQEEIEALKEKLEQMKSLPQEIQYLHAALQEERFRTERLEEQINDLTELHQNEVENLKQAMADMEEKVQYQSEERLRDIHEILEHCQTKIQKMEHQALQQQQYVTLEGLDNSNARALVVKLINILLTVLQVVLLLVATGAGIIMPFLRTRVRILTTVFIVLATVFILRQWPEVQDIGSHVMKRLKDMLDPVK
ncbi:transmembrane and coiled-coil domains protein 2 isoform X5 [Tribolium castaneum]|uniref:transmembrane and coiled-coil domains protein 2 isoform X5 n=1 Tax=Tribolium castaneum TaxID=7070 RepID=UPI00046C1CB0|nr:PREDICTED: transmembrane and coiled-coil domains protein 2 isoform X6 [Tribolium castaneum]|eukprot:XP_008191028.1 PREDICTED: transmembrane and coiled-coil domains protein 2 isoform X6 [Tribolium castaneum]